MLKPRFATNLFETLQSHTQGQQLTLLANRFAMVTLGTVKPATALPPNVPASGTTSIVERASTVCRSGKLLLLLPFAALEGCTLHSTTQHGAAWHSMTRHSTAQTLALHTRRSTGNDVTCACNHSSCAAACEPLQQSGCECAASLAGKQLLTCYQDCTVSARQHVSHSLACLQ